MIPIALLLGLVVGAAIGRRGWIGTPVIGVVWVVLLALDGDLGLDIGGYVGSWALATINALIGWVLGSLVRSAAETALHRTRHPA